VKHNLRVGVAAQQPVPFHHLEKLKTGLPLVWPVVQEPMTAVIQCQVFPAIIAQHLDVLRK